MIKIKIFLHQGTMIIIDKINDKNIRHPEIAFNIYSDI